MGPDVRTLAPVRIGVAVVVVTILTTWAAWSVVVSPTGAPARPHRAAAAAVTVTPLSAPSPPPSPAAAAAPAEQAAPSATEQVLAVRRGPVAPAGTYTGGVEAIPAPAFAAYQRAASIIDATVDCGLDWSVLAAIGRVESGHGLGAHGTHRVTARGRVVPAFVGAPLDGRDGRGLVADSDGGALDGNPVWDAPVGPMGHLPSTWSTVAVDADGDGARSPQDLDDAALAAAVLLCAGGSDLRHPAALRDALASYDRARGFAPTVRALADRYARWAPPLAVPGYASSLTTPLAGLVARARPAPAPLRPAAATPAAAQAARGPAPHKHPARPAADEAAPPRPAVVPATQPQSPPPGPPPPADDPNKATEEPATCPTQDPAGTADGGGGGDACPPQQPSAGPAEEPGGGSEDPAGGQASQPGQEPAAEPSTEPVPDSAP